MSEFHVRVVEVREVTKHPNADTLSITQVDNYPVVVRTGDFLPRDRALYIPVDAVVPNISLFAFLCGDKPAVRVKAKRLRGVFSMGLLVPVPAGIEMGDADIATKLGITKYEPPEPLTMGGDNETDPGVIPVYTDIEGLRRWPEVLRPGEEVIITEKIHGCNGRWVYHKGRLWVGSHTGIKRPSDTNLWWKVAHQYGLASKCAETPGVVLYGEVYGQVQDLKYGVTTKGQVRLVLFDALKIAMRTYLEWDEFCALADRHHLPVVPCLYRGPWDPSLVSLAEGQSTLIDAHNVREGIVVRSVPERLDDQVGRVILKRLGEDYMLR